MSPQQRAWLDTIAHAEGTFRGNSPEGYRVMFGGGLASPEELAKGHPDRVIDGGRYKSAATGRYQFMPRTWAGLGGGAMTPEAQDAGALRLMQQRGVDPSKPLDRQSVAKLAPEWASLPTLQGRSYYGQPVKGYDELSQFYSQRLQHYGKGGAPAAATVAQAPAAAVPVAAAGSAPAVAIAPPSGSSGDELAVTAAMIAELQGSSRRSRQSIAPLAGLLGSQTPQTPSLSSGLQLAGQRLGVDLAAETPSQGPDLYEQALAMVQEPVRRIGPQAIRPSAG